MKPNRSALALAIAGLGHCPPRPGGRAPAATTAFDPLLDGRRDLCGPSAGGQPVVLRALILAKTETAPFQPVPAKPALGDAPVLYQNLGTLTLQGRHARRAAQAWFDQGVRLSFAFNHAEAQRAFREAQKLDPQCALCYWGEALILGPNINVPMMPEANEPALAALAKAVALARERAAARPRADRRARRSATRPIRRPSARRSTPRTPTRWTTWRSSFRRTTLAQRCTPKR